MGWLLAIVGTTVYLLTMEPTVSFWDCGEFIAVSYLLQVGHPPGAPLYQLLAHAFMWMAGGDVMLVAQCSNALSAVAGGLTVMFLFWSILLTTNAGNHLPALVGALCYLFCDTAWFSATESEVYALAMLIASAMVWAGLRWYRDGEGRWLPLAAFLAGLGACVHLLTLLTLPAILILVGIKGIRKQPIGFYLLAFAFFFIGLTPYLIIPIRAAAGTPINEGQPSTSAAFRAYIARDRYEHAPLWPRMWRKHANDDVYAASWSGGDKGLEGNLRFYASYQLGYMYLRYLMWNFAGRFNDRQGYGSPQNGQFITGIPPLDRLLVGTGARPPDSLPTRGHNRYFLLPLLTGLVGIVSLWHNRCMFWALLALFFMGGVALNIYLNHPAYEPRERDYAYILSFYAFAFFIAHGTRWLISKISTEGRRPCGANSSTIPPVEPTLNSQLSTLNSQLLFLALPLLMAFQNWDDHDRSRRYIAHDAGVNILNSQVRDAKGSVLFTYGDNDTFPLWYLQTVEEVRLDVRVENIGLMGWGNFVALLQESIAQERPVYLTHYAYNKFRRYLPGRLVLEGNTYRLRNENENNNQDSVDCEAFFRHLYDGMGWHSLEGVYIDETGCKFLEQYWKDVVLLAENLVDRGEKTKALAALDKTLAEIPLTAIQDVLLMESIAEAYRRAGDEDGTGYVVRHLRSILREQLEYYHGQSERRQRYMPLTIGPREELWGRLLPPARQSSTPACPPPPVSGKE